MKDSIRDIGHRNLHMLLTIAGVAGIAGLFLPFCDGASPLVVVLSPFLDVWNLGAPFFLSIFVLAANTRWIVSGSLSATERAIGYFISVATACFTLYAVLVFFVDEWPFEFFEWVVVEVPTVVLVLGAYLVFVKSRNPVTKGITPVIALQVAYLANFLMCFVGFAWEDELQIGAYFCLAAAIAYLCQIVLFSVHSTSLTDDGRKVSVP